MWLGPPNETSDLAVALLERIDQTVKFSFADSNDGPSESLVIRATGEELDCPMRFDPIDLLALMHLLGRPCFTRLWIYQEAAYANRTNSIFQVGRATVLWSAFFNATMCLLRRGLKSINVSIVQAIPPDKLTSSIKAVKKHCGTLLATETG